MSSVHALVVALVDAAASTRRIASRRARCAPIPPTKSRELVRELRIQNHWSMKPLWPLQKWGWGASAVM
jgi:hypothetical protein